MIIKGPWPVADYVKAGIDYGYATLPVVTGTQKPASPFVGVKTLMLGGYATNPALAVDVMKFFTNKDNQSKMVLATREVPAHKPAPADPPVQALPHIAR